MLEKNEINDWKNAIIYKDFIEVSWKRSGGNVCKIIVFKVKNIMGIARNITDLYRT